MSASRLLTARARLGDATTVTGYVVLITAAELCTSFVGPLAGAAAYSILLFAMLTDAVIRLAPAERGAGNASLDVAHAVLALSFLPIIRLVSMSAPVGAGSEAGRYLIVGGLVLGAIAWAVWGVGLPGIVLRVHAPRLQLAVVCAAVPILLVGYAAIRPDSIGSSTRGAELELAGAVALAGIVDELVFRGFVQSALARLYGPLVGPLVAAAVYVVSYLDVRPASLIALAAVLALVFGWFAEKTQSLLGVTVSHSVLNVGLFVVLPHAAASSSTLIR